MSQVPAETPERLRNWGLHAVSSPLYHHLIEVIATDEDLIRVINRIENFPRPNVLFGAVHYLLEESHHELVGFYGSLVASPRPADGAGPVFKDFVLTHEEEIVTIGQSRLTQTNECRRCVSLLPGVMATGLGRFHLIEIGASAGLNLALDKYHYRWSGIGWGPETSAVTLSTHLNGTLPSLHAIDVLSRTGLDLNPVDPSDPEDRRWLEALIWPEHNQRRSRLQAALELAAGLDMELVAGDATETLEPAIAGLPSAEPVIVMDSFSLNQFSREARSRIEEVVHAAREHRPIARVSLEPLAAEAAASLKIQTGDGWLDMARMHHHGEWVEFYARP